MTPCRIHARRGAEQRERLAGGDAGGEARDPEARGAHLVDVAAGVLVPRDGRAVLAVDGGVELGAGAELGEPGVPRLGVAPDAARAEAAHEEAVAVVGL